MKTTGEENDFASVLTTKLWRDQRETDVRLVHSVGNGAKPMSDLFAKEHR